MTWSRPCGRLTGRPRSSPSNQTKQRAALLTHSLCVRVCLVRGMSFYVVSARHPQASNRNSTPTHAPAPPVAASCIGEKKKRKSRKRETRQ